MSARALFESPRRTKSPSRLSMGETSKSFLLGHDVNAHLTINSLILLDFSGELYSSKYRNFSHESLLLTDTAFDHKNERLLLVILHFLLTLLDGDEFPTSITDCWPFLDKRDKSRFVHAVRASLRRVLGEEEMVQDAHNFSIQSALMTNCKRDIWLLLRVLAEQAIDNQLELLEELTGESNALILDTSGSFYHQAKHEIHNLPTVKEQSGQHQSNNEDNEHQQEQEEDDNDVDDEESCEVVENVDDVFRLNGIGKDEHTQLCDHIHKLSAELSADLMQFASEQSEWSVYIYELESRLRNAQQIIDSVERESRQWRLSDDQHWLSSHGDAKRAKSLQRVRKYKDVLTALLNSSLMSDVHKAMNEELVDTNNTNNNHNNSSVTTDEEIKRSRQRDRETSMICRDQRQLLSTEEFDKFQCSLKNAVVELINKINETVAVL